MYWLLPLSIAAVFASLLPAIYVYKGWNPGGRLFIAPALLMVFICFMSAAEWAIKYAPYLQKKYSGPLLGFMMCVLPLQGLYDLVQAWHYGPRQQQMALQQITAGFKAKHDGVKKSDIPA